MNSWPDAIPTGRDAIPTGQDAIPTGRDAIPTGQDAIPTETSAPRPRPSEARQRYGWITSCRFSMPTTSDAWPCLEALRSEHFVGPHHQQYGWISAALTPELTCGRFHKM